MTIIQKYIPFRLGVKFDNEFNTIENTLRNYGTRPHILNEDGTLSDPVINTLVVGHATFDKANPGNLEAAIKFFAAPRGLSAHYIVDNENTYQVVDDSYRAWHSGVSAWSKSLGTIVNYDQSGSRKESPQISVNDNALGVWFIAKEETLTQYSESQTLEAATLIQSLMGKHNIHPLDVAGFHDVKLCQAYDPAKIGLPLNVTLPWPALIKSVPGLSEINSILETHANEPFTAILNLTATEPVESIQLLLQKIGYAIEPTGAMDNNSKCAIHTFYMHYNQAEFTQAQDESGWVNTWTTRALNIAVDLAVLRNELVVSSNDEL